MKSYYKYTSGESFTLNDTDYHGFFSVENENVFTGKLSSIKSEPLVKKHTLLSDVYSNKLELDNVYKNINKTIPYYSNVFDLINKQEIDRLSTSIEYNNLKMFGGGIMGNPYLYNMERNNNHFYGFSDTDVDLETLHTNTQLTDSIPFSYTTKWEFLDRIKSGEFVVDGDGKFKYICSTGLVNYIIKGDFIGDTPITILDGYPKYLHPDFTTTPDYTHSIYHDVEDSKVVFVNDDFIEIYDSSNFYDCDNLPLIDKIKLIPTDTTEYFWNNVNFKFSGTTAKWGDRYTIVNDNNPKFIKFGKNIRTSLNGSILSIIVKYSSTVYKTIDLSLFDVGEILELSINPVDDNILILNKISDKLYIMVLDVENISDNTPINTLLESISLDMPWYVIKFSEIDSNIFYIYNSKEYQARYLTHPSYPYGRLENGRLLYHDAFKWNEAFEKFSQTSIIFGSTIHESNTYNNIISCETVKNGKMYMLHHNIGRLYTLHQPLSERYMTNIPIDLIKYTNPVKCCNSSLGVYFNTIIINNTKDTLNIFNKSSGSFKFEEFKVSTIPITDLDYNVKDFYINGNETFNVTAIQRITQSVTNLQSKTIPLT